MDAAIKIEANYWKILAKGLAIVAAFIAPFLIYFSTTTSIISIWNSSETFAHGYIILPISLWLIWRRRQALALLPIQPFWPGLALILVAGAGWMLADLGDVQVVRQYSFVALLPLTVLVILGWRMALTMAFPLCFLMLAVPFGDVFIEPLINFTADFTVAALQMTGIPVLRNGTSFSLPSGNWQVAEACSGVRYLISSFTLGCLYAYLTYHSWKKQLIFVVMAIIVPIFANGVRAYLIVMLGHLSGMTLAVGVDHIIYGWLFFGLVMFLMFWIGNYWRDDNDKAGSAMAINHLTGTAGATTYQVMAATAAVIICLAIWPLYANYITRANHNPVIARLDNFQSDWPKTSSFTDWSPSYLPDSTELNQSYAKDGHQINLLVKYYRNQTHDTALISSNNRMIRDGEELWIKTSTITRDEKFNGINLGAARTLSVSEAQIKSSSEHLLVWSWNWISGQFIVNNYLGKILQTRDKLRIAGDDGAAVILSAPYTENPEEARLVLRRFLSTNLDRIEATLNANRKP
ncbi:exosortase A [Solimicrobium silvestre]|uniref:Exosortase A n=1 Tax=Solimicrobium silvestre TaxID=2099400 RepID=A0A2S9H0M4_9BURK|nr:exosortase A [Solimicrobium silvestre]PRC93535.1 Exosortase A [Solimicrobium silvestre]